MRGFFGKRILAVFIVALAVSLWVLMSAPLAQTSKAEKPVVQKAAPLKLEKPKDQKAIPLNKPAIPPATEVEIQRRFNELRRELLDERADFIDRWLAVVAIVLTFFGIVVAILGLIGFRRFQAIEREARESVEATNEHLEEAKRNNEEAKRLVEEIEGYRDEVKDIRDETAETAADEPERVKQIAKDVRENPESPLIEKAIADAISLQQEQKLEEAIEKWQAISKIAVETDKDLAARAWFSIGYLLGQQGKHEEAIGAYNETLRLKPDYTEVYNNRGNAKNGLGRHEAAIADYDEALILNPNLAVAYNNRGSAKDDLSQHEAAVADYDEALRLNPNDAGFYYNRGNAKNKLDQHQDAIADYNEAIRLNLSFAEAYYNRGLVHQELENKIAAQSDFEKARDLARAASNETLAALAEQRLRELDKK